MKHPEYFYFIFHIDIRPNVPANIENIYVYPMFIYNGTNIENLIITYQHIINAYLDNVRNHFNIGGQGVSVDDDNCNYINLIKNQYGSMNPVQINDINNHIDDIANIFNDYDYNVVQIPFSFILSNTVNRRGELVFIPKYTHPDGIVFQ
jgi:hypothetical protein